MRMLFPYALCAALCVLVVFKTQTAPVPTLPQHATVYDSTLAILKEFAAKDPRLGFADQNEIDSAWIDMNENDAIPLVYAFEDSVSIANHIEFATDTSQTDSLFVDIHRVIRPVFTRRNGAAKLCAAITFDSTGGVHPIMFDDSSLLLPTYLPPRPDSLMPTRFRVARVPSLGIFIYIMVTPSGKYVAVTPDLRLALGSFFPEMTPLELQYQFLTKKQVFRAIQQRLGKLKTLATRRH